MCCVQYHLSKIQGLYIQFLEEQRSFLQSLEREMVQKLSSESEKGKYRIAWLFKNVWLWQSRAELNVVTSCSRLVQTVFNPINLRIEPSFRKHKFSCLASKPVLHFSGRLHQIVTFHWFTQTTINFGVLAADEVLRLKATLFSEECESAKMLDFEAIRNIILLGAPLEPIFGSALQNISYPLMMKIDNCLSCWSVAANDMSRQKKKWFKSWYLCQTSCFISQLLDIWTWLRLLAILCL